MSEQSSETATVKSSFGEDPLYKLDCASSDLDMKIGNLKGLCQLLQELEYGAADSLDPECVGKTFAVMADYLEGMDGYFKYASDLIGEARQAAKRRAEEDGEAEESDDEEEEGGEL